MFNYHQILNPAGYNINISTIYSNVIGGPTTHVISRLSYLKVYTSHMAHLQNSIVCTLKSLIIVAWINGVRCLSNVDIATGLILRTGNGTKK